MRGTNGSDGNHGLGYYGGSKPWGSIGVDGPVLYGASGGVLGVRAGSATASVLSWNESGQVGLGSVQTPGSGFAQFGNTALNTLGADGQGGNRSGGVGSLTWGLDAGGYAGQFYNANSSASGNGLAVKANGSNASATVLDVSTGAQATTGTSRLVVKAGGHVGINKAAPTSTLHVGGSTSTVRLEGLAGTGTRTLTVAADGTLGTSTSTIVSSLQVGTGTVGTAGTVTVGTPGGTAGTGSVFPFRGYWHDSRTLFLYQASALAAAGLQAGLITELAFNVAVKGSTRPYQNFTLQLANTTATSVPATFPAAGTMTTVHTSTHTTTVGWNAFALTAGAFAWDGTSNLLVQVCFDNTALSNDDEVNVLTASYTATYSLQKDGDAGCTLTGTTANVQSESNNNLPVVRFAQPGPYTLPTMAGTAGQVLTQQASGAVAFADLPAGDNLGNHTATQNLSLGTYRLTGNGGTSGLRVAANGRLLTDANNVLLGRDVGNPILSGSNNVVVGYFSGLLLTTGGGNSAFGATSGSNLTTGDNNAFLGIGAGGRTSTGSRNVFVGLNAGEDNDGGSNNTALGASAGVASSALTNATALGYNAKVSQSNSLVLGGTGTDVVKVGIGTTAPAATLHVEGSSSTVRLAGLAGTGTRLVTADASGNLAATSTVAQGGTMLSFTGGKLGLGTSADVSNSRVSLSTGSSTENGLFVGLTGSSTANSLKLEHNGSNFIVRPLTAGGIHTVLENSAGNLLLNPTSATTNVGIRTTLPTEALDVDGNIQVSGNVQMGYLLMQRTYTLSGSTRAELFLGCPSGYRVMGGGGGHRDLNSAASDIRIQYTGPDVTSPETTWRLIVENTADAGVSRQIQMYCNCARIAN